MTEQREDGRIGDSPVKKLDFFFIGEGEGGICDRVSTVRSDKEGLGGLREGVLKLAIPLLGSVSFSMLVSVGETLVSFSM